MKILQIFGAVVAVHLLAFIFIFASPGCQSGPRNIPTPDATMPSSTAMTTVTFDSGAATPQPVDLVAAAPVMPAVGSGHAVPTRPGSAAAVAVTPPKPTADVAPVSTYTVVKGDSMWSIAQKNHMTVAELAKANNLGAGAVLQPGKKLIIPGKFVTPKDPSAASAVKPATDKAAAAPARANSEAMIHKVVAGESLGVIARKYQVTVGELAAANNLNGPTIRAGQQLVIPGFKAVNGKGTTTAVAKSAAAETTPAVPVTPHFEIAAPPPGQDLDSGLKGAGTEVPTIKVEDPKAEQPPKK